MKQIDIKDISLTINLTKLQDNLNNKISFCIILDGAILDKKQITSSDIILFDSTMIETNDDIYALDKKTLGDKLFKNNYKITYQDDNIVLSISQSWQEILRLNSSRVLYEDHFSDGVEVFGDKDIEEIGWHSTAFDINYRQLTSFIESNCDGNVLYYDSAMGFYGLIFATDYREVYVKLYNFVKEAIEQKIKDEQIIEFDDDQLESATFFDLNI